MYIYVYIYIYIFIFIFHGREIGALDLPLPKIQQFEGPEILLTSRFYLPNQCY